MDVSVPLVGVLAACFGLLFSFILGCGGGGGVVIVGVPGACGGGSWLIHVAVQFILVTQLCGGYQLVPDPRWCWDRCELCFLVGRLSMCPWVMSIPRCNIDGVGADGVAVPFLCQLHRANASPGVCNVRVCQMALEASK